jgi:hypothetical protein
VLVEAIDAVEAEVVAGGYFSCKYEDLGVWRRERTEASGGRWQKGL